MRITPPAQPITAGELALERGAAPIGGAGGPTAGASAPSAIGGVFEMAMRDAVGEAATRSQVADAKVQGLAAGTADDLHGTLISTKEAEISLRLVNSVRNKLLDAFHELWRTNV